MKRVVARWIAHARSPMLAWLATYATVLAVLAWSRRLEVWWLAGIAGTCAVGGGALLLGRDRWRFPGARNLIVALAIALVVLAFGARTDILLTKIRSDWPTVEAERHAARAAELEAWLNDAVERGSRAAALAASIAQGPRVDDLFSELARARAAIGVDALAIFNDNANPSAWAGHHGGPIPDDARIGGSGAHFVESPLHSYLYFVEPVGGSLGARGVSAVLIDDATTGGAAIGRPFWPRAPAQPVLRAGAPRGDSVLWSLANGSDTIAHALFAHVTQSDVRAEVETGARRAGALAGLAMLILLLVGWPRWARIAREPRGALLLGAALAFGIAPLGAAFGISGLYSPLLFVLPRPGDLTLGTAFAVAIPMAAFIAGLRAPPVRAGARVAALAIAGFIAALGYPAVIAVMLSGATPQLLQQPTAFWVGLQLSTVLILTVLGALVMPRFDRSAARLKPGRRTNALLAIAMASSALLGVLVLIPLEPSRNNTTWLAGFWAAPLVVAALALAHRQGNTGRLARWLVSGWIAATAVLPHFWVAYMDARLEAAGREIETLGSTPPPILDFRLHEFGRQIGERLEAGEDSVQLLYRTWLASGLANEPYGAHMILWRDSPSGMPDPEVELSLGIEEDMRGQAALAVPDVFTVERTGELNVRAVPGVPTVVKIMAAPLPDGRTVTVSVAPRRSLERPLAVAPFLGSPTDPSIELTLIEAIGPGGLGPLLWARTGGVWRAETTVQFPEATYRAHLEVTPPALGMRFARAVLLFALDSVALILIWALGHLSRGGRALPGNPWRRWRGSFQARVTLALFSFFLLPTVAFGAVAYRALADEVERSARQMGERAVQQAVSDFPQPINDLTELAARTGTDVLSYLEGELVDASSSEALELGIYDAWMPPAVFNELRAGESARASAVQDVGGQSFLMAYHLVRPTGVLAVPTPLSAGEIATRRRDLAHLVMFAALVGALLSLALSLEVGRTLAGPIARLRRAAAAVGSGQLNVRLPEAGGEFGQVFDSFNRMTRRLRRARAQEVRTARVIAWGEMSRQIAHEIKNPLTPIKLAIQHLRRAYNDRRPEFKEILEDNSDQILLEIDRLTEIARAFSRYGAPGEVAGPLEPVDLGGIVREALTLYRAGDAKVAYRAAIPSDLPLVSARTGELKEVLLNLLENARAALDGRGTIEVRARDLLSERVELEVRDDGRGIPPELIERIFDPHFSTRSTGTGLGLAIVRRIVESWGGSVTAESDVGSGTTVRVKISYGIETEFEERIHRDDDDVDFDSERGEE